MTPQKIMTFIQSRQWRILFSDFRLNFETDASFSLDVDLKQQEASQIHLTNDDAIRPLSYHSQEGMKFVFDVLPGLDAAYLQFPADNILSRHSIHFVFQCNPHVESFSFWLAHQEHHHTAPIRSLSHKGSGGGGKPD